MKGTILSEMEIRDVKAAYFRDKNWRLLHKW